MTPEFYATQEIGKEYLVEGIGFMALTTPMIGTGNYTTQGPDAYQHTENPNHMYDVEIIDNRHMRLTKRTDIEFSFDTYLGGIFTEVNRDVVWLNTKPQ